MHLLIALAAVQLLFISEVFSQAQIHICDSFAQQRHRAIIIYVDDDEGDGTLRLCHCHVYSSDYRPYAVAALALATGPKGVTMRTLDGQRANSTRHMITGDSFTSTNVLSLGVSYLKNSRRRATYVLSMFPLSATADLKIQCSASKTGFLPDGVDNIGGGGEVPPNSGSGGTGSSAVPNGGDKQRDNSDSNISITTVALSIVIVALVGVIAATTYQYYKIRSRYKRLRAEEDGSFKKPSQVQGGTFSSGGTFGPGGPGYQNDGAYEPIPEAKYNGQIHDFPSLPPRPDDLELPPPEMAPVAPKRTSKDSNTAAPAPAPKTSAPFRTPVKKTATLPVGTGPPSSAPRPSKRAISAVEPVAPSMLPSYDMIDPANTRVDGNAYDSLDNPAYINE